MKDQNSLHVNDVWEVGGAYEYFMGRWSRLVAAGFLQWLSVPSGGSWLDVGCGTGVLSKTILEMSNPVKVRGIDQAAGFISHAQHHIRDSRAGFEVGTAESLNFASHTFDAAVSGLALNFVPQVHRAVSEMKRVTRPGGTVAAYVWDYAGGMQFLRHFWDAARTLHSNAASLDEGTRFPICSPVKLRELFMSQDIHHVELRSIDVRTHFVDFEDYWSPFLSGQGPAPAYVASLTKEQQTALREGLRSELPASPDGTIDLIARAWAVRGCA